jgi:imidazole glycerol-phosphate synthase subunit HisH
MNTAIIDYGMGNLTSVNNAIEYLGFNCEIIDNPDLISKFDKLILPGVGAFEACINNLKNKKFVKTLNEEVLTKKKPILGICLGMQVMAKKGFEGGEFEGLGWFNASVVKIRPQTNTIKVPNIGWNKIDYNKENILFQNLKDPVEVYFVHSYHMDCFDQKNIIATSIYGHKITVAVNKDNIYGTQFHPEKSQDLGLQILENFLSI